MVKTRRAIVTVITLLLTLVIGAMAAWIGYMHHTVVRYEHGVKFVVREGESFRAALNDLQKQNIIKFPLIFDTSAYLFKQHHVLKAGEYLFPKGSTLQSIFHQIDTGTGQVYYIFTIVPGWNFKQIRDALQNNSHLQHATTLLSDSDIMTQLDQANINPEGQFYPDSYYFTSNYPDIKVLKKANKIMQDKLNLAWAQRSPDLPYTTLYEALIVASLIEKEARFDQDRSIISGVIINRLRKKMLLQIDPTVIYGMGISYQGKIHKQDLLKDTPYNTYVHKGLPPTPIAMPGKESINAALHPEINDYLYYVARGDGYHQFSKSYSQHQAAVVSFIRYPNKVFFNEELIKEQLHKLIKVELF